MRQAQGEGGGQSQLRAGILNEEDSLSVRRMGYAGYPPFGSRNDDGASSVGGSLWEEQEREQELEQMQMEMEEMSPRAPSTAVRPPATVLCHCNCCVSLQLDCVTVSLYSDTVARAAWREQWRCLCQRSSFVTVLY